MLEVPNLTDTPRRRDTLVQLRHDFKRFAVNLVLVLETAA